MHWKADECLHVLMSLDRIICMTGPYSNAPSAGPVVIRIGRNLSVESSAQFSILVCFSFTDLRTLIKCFVFYIYNIISK